MAAPLLRLDLADEEATRLLGEDIAAILAPGDVIALGWGRTLKFAIGELPRRTRMRCSWNPGVSVLYI